MAFAVGGAGVSGEEDRARRLRRLLIAGFVAALLPLLPGELRYHGDERFYTDGALQMLRSGDYVTPVYADGRPRFLKPGLAYWGIAASFQACGVSLAASRLPSLLAAAGVLWLTGRTVLALGGSESASLLAVALLGSNMSLLLVAVRSTPDALLCLFLSMSVFGFLRLIVRDDLRPGSYALAYLGAGMAVAAKGLLGLLPVVFSFAFCALARRRGAPSPRSLVHRPTMLAGAAIGLFWFAAVLGQHGSAAWSGFFGDQVSGKIERSWLRAAGNVPRYLLATLQHFLPWSALAAVAWLTGRGGRPGDGQRRDLGGRYALGMLAAMVAVFAAGRDMRPRYLLPAYPLLAAAVAPWFASRFDLPGRASPARLLRVLVAAGGVGGGAAIAAFGGGLDRRIAGAGLALTAMSVLVTLGGRRGWRPLVAGAALLVIAALPLHDLLVSPVFNAQPARVAAARISTIDPAPAGVSLLGLGGEFAGLLSLHLRGRMPVTVAQELPAAGTPALPTVLVATERHRGELLARGYRLEPCGFLQRRWSGDDVWRALRQGGAASYLPQTVIPVYVGVSGGRRTEGRRAGGGDARAQVSRGPARPSRA